MCMQSIPTVTHFDAVNMYCTRCTHCNSWCLHCQTEQQFRTQTARLEGHQTQNIEALHQRVLTKSVASSPSPSCTAPNMCQDSCFKARTVLCLPLSSMCHPSCSPLCTVWLPATFKQMSPQLFQVVHCVTSCHRQAYATTAVSLLALSDLMPLSSKHNNSCLHCLHYLTSCHCQAIVTAAVCTACTM